MNIDNWNWPQGLLAGWIVASIMFPLLRPKIKPFPEWLGEYIADILGYILLTFILWWGGFWE